MGEVIKISILAISLVTLFLVSGQAVNACTCKEISGTVVLNNGPRPTPEENRKRQEQQTDAALFIGEVIRVEKQKVKPHNSSDGGYSMKKVTVRVEKYWLGVRSAEMVVYTGVGGGNCGVPYVKGEKYFFLASRNTGTHLLEATACSPTRPDHPLVNEIDKIFGAPIDVTQPVDTDRGFGNGSDLGVIPSRPPHTIDSKARYLFYLHGRIVEEGLRPVSERFGVYEYEAILDTFRRSGFVVISEQRRKGTDIEQYGVQLADQIRELLRAGVPPEHITIVGASQGSWIAMLASTYLKDRNLNFVLIAGCAAEDGFLKQVNLHGNILSIYERSDLAGSCQKFRADATGLGRYKEVEVNTGLKHGFLYRPLKQWVEPTVEWAKSK